MIARPRLWLLLMLVAWLLPTVARAEARVVLAVRADDEDASRATHRRIRQELELRGFSVIDHAPAPATDPLEAALGQARSLDAALGVVVASGPDGGVHIDVVDRVTGKRLRRSLPPEPAGHERSAIALAVAELVDASLVELQLRAETAVGEIEAPPDLPVPPLPTPRLGGGVGATLGIAWPVRNPSPVAVAIADVGLRPSPRVAVLAEATLPLHAMRRELPLAIIRTLPFAFGLRTDVDVLPRRSPVRLDVQGGVSAVALRIEVDARPGAWARPQTTWTTAGVLGLRLHRTFGRVILGGALRLVAPLDDVRIRFDARVAQRLGPVWVGGGITVGTQW